MCVTGAMTVSPAPGTSPAIGARPIPTVKAAGPQCYSRRIDLTNRPNPLAVDFRRHRPLQHGDGHHQTAFIPQIGHDALGTLQRPVLDHYASPDLKKGPRLRAQTCPA